MAKGRKQPTTGGIEPRGAKRPRIAVHHVEGGPLAWRFSGGDGAGPYAWSALTPDKLHDVIRKLHDFETMKWDDIKRGGSHPIPKVQCCKDARDRLADLERDDVDELMSFRLSGTERVWCVQAANVMSVLWWDPDHQVYPTKPDKADRAKDKRKSR